jgi:hypothetical protein
VRSCTRTIDGYFQRVSWFWEKPWLLSSSRSWGLKARLHTWDPVSVLLRDTVEVGLGEEGAEAVVDADVETPSDG